MPAGSLPSRQAPGPGRRILPGADTRSSAPKPAATKSKQDEMVLKCVQEMQKLRQSMMVKYNLRSPSSILTDTSLKQIVSC